MSSRTKHDDITEKDVITWISSYWKGERLSQFTGRAFPSATHIYTLTHAMSSSPLDLTDKLIVVGEVSERPGSMQ